MKYIYLFLLYSIPVCPLQAQQKNIIDGKLDSIYSSTLDENRKFWIHVPYLEERESYEPQKYPVLFILDGETENFKFAKALVDQLGLINGNTIVPQLIVVGIQNTDRFRDFTPTQLEANSGGTDAFISFLKYELLPYIDSAYPTAPHRILVGHSLSGLAAMHCFNQEKETFAGYLVADPALWWDNQIVLKQTKKILETDFSSKVSIFLAIANTLEDEMDINSVKTDTTANTLMLRSNFALADYLMPDIKNIEADWKFYAQDDHTSVWPIALYDGLRHHFKDYKIGFKENHFSDPSFDIVSLIKNQYSLASELLGYKVKPPGDMVHGIANYMVMLGQFEKAESLLKLNVVNYPTTEKVYLDLGNFYLTIDEKELADVSFKKISSK